MTASVSRGTDGEAVCCAGIGEAHHVVVDGEESVDDTRTERHGFTRSERLPATVDLNPEAPLEDLVPLLLVGLYMLDRRVAARTKDDDRCSPKLL